jgi:hypothetical protein
MQWRERFLSAQKIDSVGPYNFQCKVTLNLPPFAFTALMAWCHRGEVGICKALETQLFSRTNIFVYYTKISKTRLSVVSHESFKSSPMTQEIVRRQDCATGTVPSVLFATLINSCL